MATKTFRIGEYAIGGIIKVETNNGKVKISCHDWDSGKLVRWAVESNRQGAYEVLTEFTSVYYADNIMEWLEKQGIFASREVWA